MISGASIVTLDHCVVKAVSVSGADRTNMTVDVQGVLYAYNSRLISNGGDSLKTVYLNGGRAEMRDTVLKSWSTYTNALSVGVEARNGADVVLDGCSVDVDTSTNQYGILFQGTASDVIVRHSTIKASTYSVYDPVASSSAFLYTHFEGGSVIGGCTCRYSTDESYSVYATTCP
jgi:hypothetical protein